MTLAEIKEMVMFQTNNDAEDVGDYLPSLVDYVNEGYDLLVYVYDRQHVDEMSAEYPPLEMDVDEPNLPGWTHKALADWATWLVYRNGNPQKQQRGYAFREAFENIKNRLASEPKNGAYRNFINIPK